MLWGLESHFCAYSSNAGGLQMVHAFWKDYWQSLQTLKSTFCMLSNEQTKGKR